MKKTKIIAILSALVILTAMTGIAAASPENIKITPDNQQLDMGQTTPGGSYSTYNLAVTEIKPEGHYTHTIYVETVTVVAGAGSNTDLWFRFTHGTSSLWLQKGAANTFTWTDSCTSTDSLSLDVMNTGSTQNTEYQFTVKDSYPYGTGTDVASGTSYGTTIPEFATIAIQVIGILGLFLFFNHRKHREK